VGSKYDTMDHAMRHQRAQATRSQAGWRHSPRQVRGRKGAWEAHRPSCAEAQSKQGSTERQRARIPRGEGKRALERAP
jgi:hypothetical protein